MSIKNVVIIGLGLAGAPAAAELAKTLPKSHRVVGLSENDFAYYPIASLRAAVVPGWENKITASVQGIFPSGSRHVILAGTGAAVLEKDHVILTKEFEGSTRLNYDFCIIATGSTYAFPARPPIGAHSISDVNASFSSLQSSIKSAKSILIAGAGPTGIEFAGEVKAQFPAIKVTLVSSAKTLMPVGYNKGLGKNLQGQLESIGVELVFNTRLDSKGLKTGAIEKQFFDLGAGNSVEADFLLIAYGCTANSAIVKEFDPSIVNADGRVMVKPSLQLASTDGAHDRIFAIGDVNDIKEEKISVYAEKHAAVACSNILSLIASPHQSEAKSLKTYAAGGVIIIVVVGPWGGAGQLFGLVIPWYLSAIGKSSHLLVHKFNKHYNKIST